MKQVVSYIALVALLLSACTKQDRGEILRDREICFKASMGVFQTKATDFAFEESDAIGVTVGAPVNARNVRLSVQEGALVPDKAVHWGKEQAEASYFWAYYPYAHGRDLAEGFDFTIMADQSSHAGYTASDLMTACTSATPEEDAVELPFRHRLTKLILRIDNQLPVGIADVYVGNIFGRVFVRGNEESQAKGLPGTVKTCPVTFTDGSDAWAMVLVPQTRALTLMVTTTDQKQFTYTLPEAMEFLPGNRYVTSLTLDENAVPGRITTEVSEWTDDSDIQFGHFSSFANVNAGVEGQSFLVEGTILEIANYNYGNLYLADEQGNTLYIYGIVNSAGQYPWHVEKKWYDPAFNLIPGDRIAVQGVRTVADGQIALEDVQLKQVQKYSPEWSPIQTVLDSGAGSVVATSGLVYAVSRRGFILSNGDSSVFVYTAWVPECTIGDEMVVEGQAEFYRHQVEIDRPRHRIVSSGNKPKEITYMDITDGFDDFISDVAVPVSVEGVLTISSTNNHYISVDGAGALANVYWPFEELGLQDMNGNRIRVKGYYISYYTSEGVAVRDILATEVEELSVAINPSKYLTFTSEGTSTIALGNTNDNAPVLYYSRDLTKWYLWNYSNLTFTGETPLYLCGDNPDGFSSAGNKYSYFISDGDLFGISGDVMSLLNMDEDVFEIPSDYCFIYLFGAWEFSSYCRNLKNAPDMPATVLKEGCYTEMFFNCKNLSEAPVLPATTLTDSCYEGMFAGCSSLKTAPALPATIMKRCCYRRMFQNCSSLTDAPALPASTLAEYCYYRMFRNCTSLTEAPELPAANLVQSCYSMMFNGCNNLGYIKCLATDISARDCLTDWVNGVAVEGTFVKATSMSDWPEGVNGIPEGWNVENEGQTEPIKDGGEQNW